MVFQRAGGSLCVPLYQPAGPGYLRAYYCGKTCGFCGDPRADGAGESEQGLKAPGIHRTYLAIVEGKVMPVSGVMDAPIARKEDRCLRRVVDFKRGDRAVTHYRVLTGWQTGNAQKFRSLVKLQLETGRTHQIRVHMAYLGHPLVEIFFIIRHTGKIRLTVGTMKIPGRDRFFRERLFPVEKSNMILGVRHCILETFIFPSYDRGADGVYGSAATGYAKADTRRSIAFCVIITG